MNFMSSFVPYGEIVKHIVPEIVDDMLCRFVPYGVFVKLVYLSDNQCNWGISSPMGNLLNEIGKITVKVQEAVSSPMGKLLNYDWINLFGSKIDVSSPMGRVSCDCIST